MAALASAAEEQVNTARPGGNASAFWVPASNTSRPSASNSIRAAESELTASTMNITSGYFFLSPAISTSGLMVPVEVSLWISVSASNWPEASFRSTASGRMGEPHGTWSVSAALPQRCATSNHLSEKAPHMQLSTLLKPGCEWPLPSRPRRRRCSNRPVALCKRAPAIAAGSSHRDL